MTANVTRSGLRTAILVVGSASIGAWISSLLYRAAFPVKAPPHILEMADSERKLVLALAVLSLPRVAGALVAGVLLGFVARDRAYTLLAVSLVATYLFLNYWPYLFGGNLFAGSAGPLVKSLEIFSICISVLLGLWLGRRIGRNGVVA